MPIRVQCPGCQSAFLVDDEFAGRPGRCPECAGVIEVPSLEESDSPSLEEVNTEPDPYSIARPEESPGLPPPLSSRRSNREIPGQPISLPVPLPNREDERAFEAASRISAWTRVYRGLGYIQIAVILYFFNQVLQSAFFAVRGFEQPGADGMPDSGDIAIGIGAVFITIFGIIFWILGRLAGARVPYVPARGWARTSYFLVLGSIGSFFGFCCLFIMAIGALGAGPNPGAAALLMFSLLMMLLGVLMVAGGEVCGLMSLARVGDGLDEPSLASWARTSVVLMFMLIGGIIIAACGMGIYAAENQRKRQVQNPNAQNPPPIFPAPKPGGKQRGKAPEIQKDAPVPAENPPPAGNANGNPPPQQNPFGDDGLDDTTRMVFQGIIVGLILLYLIQYSITLQKGRKAIQREIRRLGGEKDEYAEYDRRE